MSNNCLGQASIKKSKMWAGELELISRNPLNKPKVHFRSVELCVTAEQVAVAVDDSETMQ